MKRTPFAIATLIVFLTSAAQASACLPPPPPDWRRWVNDPKVAIAIGRVVGVDQSASLDTESGYTVTGAVARIRLLDVLRGEFATDHAETSGAVGYTPAMTRTSDGRSIAGGEMPCLTWLAFAEGDLAIVVEGHGVFTAASAAHEPMLSARLKAFE